jgi:hypothetical protein
MQYSLYNTDERHYIIKKERYRTKKMKRQQHIAEHQQQITQLQAEESEDDGQLKLIDELLLSMEKEENKKNITVKYITKEELVEIAKQIVTEQQIERITPISTYLKHKNLKFNGDIKKALWESGLFDDTGKHWKLKKTNDDLLQ